MLEGDWSLARELAALTYANNSWRISVIGGWWLTWLAHHQGDVELARQVIAALLPEGPRTDPGNTVLWAALPLLRQAAELALDADDLAGARSWLEAHDRWLDWSGAILGRAEGTLLWARYQRESGDQLAARGRAQEALALAGDPRQPLALAAAHRFLGRLETESRRYVEAEQQLAQSLSLAEACRAPFDRVETLLALAELRAAQGKPDEARTLLAEVRDICGPMGALPLLGQAAALETRLSAGPRSRPFGLSEREVEVLRLLAEGLTDGEIGERLFISRRTVTSHLTSIYNKLGVNTRSAATRLAVEQKLT